LLWDHRRHPRVVGIVQLDPSQIILGIVLIIAACLVGPAGYSLFREYVT
jgi:hypothetical protein